MYVKNIAAESHSGVEMTRLRHFGVGDTLGWKDQDTQVRARFASEGCRHKFLLAGCLEQQKLILSQS